MVEIKFIFTDSDLKKARDLGRLAKPTAVRTVAFFDTAQRGLLDGTLLRLELKLILRARFSSEKDRGNTTLKVRTTGPLDDSFKTNEVPGAKREIDFAFGRTPLNSYSLDDRQDRREIVEVLAGHRPVKSIFTEAQEACISRVVRRGFRWSDLRIYGPVEHVEVWEKAHIPGLERPVTFEQWLLPATGAQPVRQILELSARAPNNKLTTAVNEIRRVLEGNGINPSASETKTKMVLEHFVSGRKAK